MISVRFGSLTAILLCCIVFACITPTENEGESASTVNPWFPLSEGSTWRYQCIDSDGSGIAGTPYVESYTISGEENVNGNTYKVFTDSEDNTTLFRFTDSVLYEFPSDMPEKVAMYDLTLAAGASTVDTLTFTDSGETVTFIGTLTYHGAETVETLIGSFPSCKKFELRATVADGIPLGTMTQWFDKNIGRVKLVVEDYTDGVLLKTTTDTVIYYNIVGGPNGGNTGRHDVSGRVVDPEGKGISGITVRLMAGGDDNPEMTTGDDGSYTFEEIQAGPSWIGIIGQREDYWIDPDHYEIEVIADDFTVDDFVGVYINDPDGSSVSGTITTEGGVIVDGTHITMTRLHGIWEEDTIPGQGYSFINISDGTYTITPSLEGYTFIPPEQTVTVEGSNVTADLVAVGGNTITGRLVTLLGTGVADIVMMIRFNDNTSVEAVSGADGYYTFTEIPSGSYDIYNRDEGGTYSLTPHQVSVTVDDSDVTIDDISVVPTGGSITLSGTIRNSRGNGQVNGPVTLYDTVFGIEWITWANPDGSFSFENLYNGTFTITSDVSPYTMSTVSRQVTIDGENVSGVAFTFTAFSVSGRVVDEDGNGIAGITISLGGVGYATITIKTVADGRFTFIDIIEGDFTVQPEQQGYTFTPGFHWFQLRGEDTFIGTFTGSPVIKEQ
jgi:hypothetical protein